MIISIPFKGIQREEYPITLEGVSDKGTDQIRLCTKCKAKLNRYAPADRKLCRPCAEGKNTFE